ncbi:MAG: DUF4388 domain-containing protein [Trueperaceae bacterium]|nr:DUF4388 domain-containing protein [Trueperaceae bacterium]
MFYGDLDDLPISDVLGGLERRTGTLIVTTRSVRIEIYLDNGAACSVAIGGRVVTKAHLVPKLLAKLLGVKQGSFLFASGEVRPERYRLPLPWLLIEAAGAIGEGAAASP